MMKNVRKVFADYLGKENKKQKKNETTKLPFHSTSMELVNCSLFIIRFGERKFERRKTFSMYGTIKCILFQPTKKLEVLKTP